eukprot:g12306.t1
MVLAWRYAPSCWCCRAPEHGLPALFPTNDGLQATGGSPSHESGESQPYSFNALVAEQPAVLRFEVDAKRQRDFEAETELEPLMDSSVQSI